MPGLSQIQLIVAVAALVVIGLMGWRINYLETENSELHDTIGQYKARLNELAETIKTKDRDIDRQNKAVDELKKEGEARELIAKEKLAEASKKAVVNEKRAQDILALVPKSSDLCKEVDSLLNDYLKSRSNADTPTPSLPVNPSLKLSTTSLRF